MTPHQAAATVLGTAIEFWLEEEDWTPWDLLDPDDSVGLGEWLHEGAERLIATAAVIADEASIDAWVELLLSTISATDPQALDEATLVSYLPLAGERAKDVLGV